MAKEIDKLKKLRDKIDVIDDKLLNLIQSRADIASKIGKLKGVFNNELTLKLHESTCQDTSHTYSLPRL